MNRKLLIFINILLIFALIPGCGDSDKNEAEYLEVSEQNIDFVELESKKYFLIRSNTDWTVTCDQNWLNFLPVSGKNNFSIEVAAQANNNPDIRTATITVSSNNAPTQTVLVTQGGLEPFIIISPKTLDALTFGENVTIEVTASYQWGIKIPDEDADWIVVKSQSQTQAELTVYANQTGEDRLSNVTFGLMEFSDKFQTYPVSQPAMDIEFPDEGEIANEITLTGANVNLTHIREVWFGDVKGTIADGQTAKSMTVAIPSTTGEGTYDLKIVTFNDFEVIVGQIVLKLPIAPEVTLPAEAVIGRKINLTGENLDIITEVWFGDAEGVIAEGFTAAAMDVTVPAAAKEGEADVKVIYVGNQELVAGKILLKLVAPEVVAPTEGYIGGKVTLTGTNLDFIDKIFFGELEGAIAADRTDASLNVTIPATATPGTVALKAIYLETKELAVGSITLSEMPFDPTENLCRFAGSCLSDVPALTTGRDINGAYNVDGGRNIRYAFDGVKSQADKDLVDYASIYQSCTLSGFILSTRTSTPLTYWQSNSGAILGEVEAGGTAWFKLDYSATSKGSVTFDKIVIHPRGGAPNTASFTIEVSDDNTTWTKIIKAEDSPVLNTAWATAVPLEFEQTVTAKYVRYVVISSADGELNTGSGYGNIGLTSFEMYRTKP